jgi:uncharacterized protein DUF1161
MNVRPFLAVAPLIVAAIPISALAKDCNEVKAEVDAKIKAKGVVNYVLRIVKGPDAKEGQIVGNCDVGAKKIVYFRESSGKSAIKLPAPSPKPTEPVSAPPATPVGTEASR